jgi:ssDNA-binding Zn-finger/Zn-ribbon topoisomerase 1
MALKLGTVCEHRCPDCGGKMKLKDSRYGLFYGCVNFPACRATHGAHPDGRPLGIPATKEVKLARIEAHAAFDLLWRRDIHGRGGGMRRKDAYQWLRSAMELPADECHIGLFDLSQCQRVVQLVAHYMEKSHARPQTARPD